MNLCEIHFVRICSIRVKPLKNQTQKTLYEALVLSQVNILQTQQGLFICRCCHFLRVFCSGDTPTQ